MADYTQTIDEVVARLPGASLFGDAWKTPADVPVEVANDASYDRESYTFARALLNAAIAEYGPLDDEEVMEVPRLVADALEFFSDSEQEGYWVQEVTR